MSADPYGFDAHRREVALWLGITTATAERDYPDEWLHERSRENEAAGIPLRDAWAVVGAATFTTCTTCEGPSHLTDEEQTLSLSVMAEVFYVTVTKVADDPDATPIPVHHGPHSLDLAHPGPDEQPVELLTWSLHRRAGVTIDQQEDAEAMMKRFGQINRDRCVAERVKQAASLADPAESS